MEQGLQNGEPDDIVRFGIFEANLHAGELRRNGSRVRLQDQPFQVLTLLLERPGQLVTREELRARLWPADTFVDFDHGLNAAIKRLRDALGDSAENPRFVETLARRGYRFLAPVSRDHKEALPIPNAPIAPTPPAIPTSRRRWILGMAVAAMVLLGASAGWKAGHRSSAAIRFSERRLTNNPENDPILSAALSPDAKYVVFADRNGLFLRVVAGGETHPVVLQDRFKTWYVNWFPDGSHVLVTRSSSPSEKPSLWSASVFGGSPRKLMENADRGAVSPDGSKIAFLRGEYGSEEIWQMQSDGTQARKIFGRLGDNFDSVVWSPDSQRIAFLRSIFKHGWGEADASLGICDPLTGKTNYILSSSRLEGPLVWALDGRLIYTLAEPAPNQNDSDLWAIKLDGRNDKIWSQPSRVTNGPDAKMSASISTDGRHLLYLRRAGAPDVYVAEVLAGGRGLGPLHRLSLGEGRNMPFSWTADGKSVIFASDREGAYHIFKQSLDQPAPDLLVGGDSDAQGARLNPDGSEILFLENPSATDKDRRTRLMRVSISGGTPQLVLAELGLSNLQCARSPSKTCIVSKSANGLVFVIFDPVTGKEAELTRIEDSEWYLRNWTLSPDGSTLALAKKHRIEEEASIRFLPVAGGTEHTITLKPWSGISYIDWAADSRSLWVRASSPAGVPTLLNVDLNGNSRAVLQESEKELGWAIPSPDGRHIAIWEASSSSNAWLLENF
jgi:Tol biopolymer transport system component/DNA-binding winged helix-turn-helix (wHTH) protein